MSGTVVTFYSYKGGVGRSFTLANVAVLLARWGHRVLVIDWDLEAPGLDKYFAPLLDEPPAAGVLDLVDDFEGRRSGVVRATPLRRTEPGVVDLLAAGVRDESYTARVQDVDWAGLYERGFGDYLERRRAEWVAEYDFVLVDSRTGISDIGGICTAHLPDRLVLLFTANEQSLDGVLDVAARAGEARDRMPYDRPRQTVLPVLSRFDSRAEYAWAEQWHRKCAEATAPLFRNWLVTSMSEAQMLRQVTLPYVSYWSFGEQLPVLEEPDPSADQISFSLETVAAVIAHGFDRTDLLADNRDAYVAAARAPSNEFDVDVRISVPRWADKLGTELVSELRALGVRVQNTPSGDPTFLAGFTESARHLCLVVDKTMTRWQEAEAERFLRQVLTTHDDRRLFPVLTGSTDPGSLPSFLRDVQYFRLSAGHGLGDVARRIRDRVSGAVEPSRGDPDVLRTALAALRPLADRTAVPDSVRTAVAALIGELEGQVGG